MIILSLITGLGIGTYLPIQMSTIIALGMMVSIVTPLISPLITVFGLGVGIAVTCKNVLKKSFKEETETEKEEKEEKAKKEYNYYSSTLAFSALPLYLLKLAEGLSQFLLPVSFIQLFIKGFVSVVNNKEKALKYGVISLVVGLAGLITISSGGSSNVFLYFLTLISLPQALAKGNFAKKIRTKTKQTTMPVEAFLYGQSSDSSILGAMMLIQTVLWGSGKDVLGTLLNGETSVLLDPYRVVMILIIGTFVFLFKKYRQDKEIKKYKEEEKEKENKVVSKITSLVSLGFALTTVNPLIVIGFSVAGLILNAVVDQELIRKLAVPVLLVAGVVVG